MADVTYRVIDLDEAADMGLYRKEDLDDWGAGWGIWRCEDGEPVELIGEDGGEPEDETLTRDWSWVAPALESAYKLGRASR